MLNFSKKFQQYFLSSMIFCNAISYLPLEDKVGFLFFESGLALLTL